MIAIVSGVCFSSVEGIDLLMPLTPVVRVEPIYQTPEALKSALEIRSGHLGKSGPELRAKIDAARNTRKTGGGSIFIQGFTFQLQYGSRPINNKLLSCQNNVKIKDDLFNPNHDDRFDKLSKNPEAKKEVLAGLDRMNKGELLPRNQKNFKGFKTLKEIKLTDTRMLVQPGKNGGPDEIVAIFMRRDLDNIASIFTSKYK